MRFLIYPVLCAAAFGQSFEYRGFIEAQLTGFPQTTQNDSGNVVGRGIFRWEMAYKMYPWLTISGGIQAQTDSHHETERSLRLDYENRGMQRPAFQVRNFEFRIHRDHFTADIGKQFIRWGKADILNPTDRFAPRDYLSVVDNEFLAVLATRAIVEGGGNSLDVVWTPRFTPSRTPLLNQRWSNLPENLPGMVVNEPARFPGGGQYGMRFNRVGNGYEASASWFEGYNHLPLYWGNADAAASTIRIQHAYPRIRMVGADSAISFPWFTLKTEAAAILAAGSKTDIVRSDDYILYVAQLERQVREWTFVGGYAGQTVLERRNLVTFDPERGLTRAFLGRVNYNIDARSYISLELAVRQNGEGAWSRVEYSRSLGSHWRATIDLAAVSGDSNDFFGQYRRNSHAMLKLRYSF